MIEPWTSQYAEGAIEVVHAVFEEYGFTWEPERYHADLYDVPGFYTDKGHEFFVALVDGGVRGTIALEVFEPIPGLPATTIELDSKLRLCGTDCSLDRMYVHPASRRIGLGASLISRVIEAARARGRKSMEIWSDKRFTDAHRLYQRFGARVVAERVCDDPDHSPEWGLRLPL